ncbi:uncharacterized protein F5891DRAFT_1194953 [Suillus fuscotomentosus]|uniref:Uncharacterized protein n=1 Tax=Suillus fuscotomentosus TaxID=1912939 RepID=A0AAD4DV99_9AGAM|nr:uncharacterized protein F5891DRAFT_1194953 [Suillus fuscotomentosus]KAG1894651.1 hypothetical protein F5891DRAFT_1194953 [Suillus fuscotomentosus]
MSTFGNHSENTMNTDACYFDPMLSGFFSFSATTVELVGYLALGHQPIVLPLYCPPVGLDLLKQELCLFAYLQTPMVHSTAYELLPSIEVPVYVLALQELAAPFLNLPWLKGKTGNDEMMQGVYNYVGVGQVDLPLTIIHLAQFPFGYQHLPEEEAIDELESVLQTTWVESSAMTSAPGVERQVRAKKVKAEHSLHRIMAACPNWCRSLAYLRIFMRIFISCGHSDNPHLLTNADYGERRLELIRSLWPGCLDRANIASHDLETVLSKDCKLPMTHNEVLALASPWITQFLYDNRRVISYAMNDARIFGLGNFFGLTLKHSILNLLQMFTRPHAHLLPIRINGFYVFLVHQAAKEMVYHIAYRTTTTNRIRLTLADLEPAIFRHAAHLPVDFLALVGSCCYQSFLTKLLSIWGTAEAMPHYPPVSQVHSELRETAVMLLQQDQDPDIATFRTQMRALCTLTETDSDKHFCDREVIARAADSKYLRKFDRLIAIVPFDRHRIASNARENIPLASLLLLSNFNMVNTNSPVPFTFETSSYSHFLGTEQTETAMIRWLQKQGRDTLPESLFVTASVLFGWIDSHDLIALLDVSLREVAMQLEREHDCCIISCSQGRCWLEDRMHRAQTEISLFSTAIANLCEELERRSSPECPKKPPTVGDVTCITYVLPSPVNFDDVRPFQYATPIPVNFDDVRPIQVMPKCDVRDKCNAWLLVLQSNGLDDSDASRIPFGSPRPEAVHFHEYLTGPDDQFLSLPRLLKTWVDNTTYRAYISASLAEFKPSCNNDGFKTKDCKSLVVLKSDIHILGLKKQRAQVEVEMLSEAIARMSEFEHTDDGVSSGSSMACASRLPENDVGSFDDWLSTSYTSSDISSLM